MARLARLKLLRKQKPAPRTKRPQPGRGPANSHPRLKKGEVSQSSHERSRHGAAFLHFFGLASAQKREPTSRRRLLGGEKVERTGRQMENDRARNSFKGVGLLRNSNVGSFVCSLLLLDLFHGV